MSSYSITITGPMFAGKTSLLIRIIREFKKLNIRCLVFKHSIDVRYATDKISSHDNDVEDCIPISSPEQIFMNESYSDAEVVIIEEVQFFDIDILSTIDKLKQDGKKLILCGLSGSYEQKAIGCMGDIYAKTEKIIQLSAICHYCEERTDAHFTAKICGSKTVIEVGNDIYKPVCNLHFNLHSICNK